MSDREAYRNRSEPFTCARHAEEGAGGGDRRVREEEGANEEEDGKKLYGVSTPDSSQAFFRRCTGQKKKCIVKRGQG